MNKYDLSIETIRDYINKATYRLMGKWMINQIIDVVDGWNNKLNQQHYDGGCQEKTGGKMHAYMYYIDGWMERRILQAVEDG